MRVCSAVVTLLALATPAAARKGPPKEPVSAVSTGNAEGPFAAALDPEGRIHLVYTSSEPDGPRRLLYRHQTGPDEWSEPEVVIDRVPDTVALEVPGTGPVVGLLAAGEAVLALREVPGWYGLSLAGSDAAPTAVALVRDGEAVRALVALDRLEAGEPRPMVRRAVLAHGRVLEAVDRPLADPGSGHLAGLHAASLGAGWDHLLLERRLPSTRILRIAGDGASDPDFRSLTATRLRESYQPTLLLPLAGRLLRARLGTVDGAGAALWSERVGAESRLSFQILRPGMGGLPELLLPATDELVSADLDSAAGRTLVAAVTGKAPGSELRVRWLESGMWGEWQAPPGADPLRPLDPIAVAVRVNAGGLGLAVTQEKWRVPGGGTQIVVWAVLPGQVVVIGR